MITTTTITETMTTSKSFTLSFTLTAAFHFLVTFIRNAFFTEQLMKLKLTTNHPISIHTDTTTAMKRYVPKIAYSIEKYFMFVDQFVEQALINQK